MPLSSTHTSRDPQASVPWITWLIGGAAVIVALTALAVYLEPQQPTEPEQARTAATETEQSPLPVAEGLPPRHPLDLSRKLLDAQERAKIWEDSARLSSIEVRVENGRTVESVTVEFGTPEKGSLVGGPIGPARLKVVYGDAIPEAIPFSDPKKRWSLADPNCPLEAAYRTLERTGAELQGDSLALYVQPGPRQRPVWLITTSGGRVSSLDGDSCAIRTH